MPIRTAALAATAAAAMAIALGAAVLALAIAPAHAAIVQTTGFGSLDSYTGEAYVTPPTFPGDPTTLTSLDFHVLVAFSERVQVTESTGQFTLHYFGHLINRPFVESLRQVTVNLIDGAGTYSSPIEFDFSAGQLLTWPEVLVGVFLTPVDGFFPGDEFWHIRGQVTVTALYDPPLDVPEPSSLVVLLAVLIAYITIPRWDSGSRSSCRSAHGT